MTASTKRSEVVKITLTPELMANLRLLSQGMGQTPAGLAALAVGQYVWANLATIKRSEETMDRIVAVAEKQFEQLTLDAPPRKAALALTTTKRGRK